MRESFEGAGHQLEVTEDANPALVGKQPFLVPEVLASLWTDYTFRNGYSDRDFDQASLKTALVGAQMLTLGLGLDVAPERCRRR